MRRTRLRHPGRRAVEGRRQPSTPAYEDLIGASAIISYLDGTRSPESEAPVAAYEDSKEDLDMLLRNCGSGWELIEVGFEDDIDIIAQLDVSECAPALRDGAYAC